MAHPFPFFGSGDASYFEWFEMWVWFEKPVPAKARARVLKAAPGPCKEDASWPLPELLWASNGDQFIGMHIINAYPNVVDPDAGDGDGDGEDDDGEDIDDDDDDDESRFIFASPAQEGAFNRGIEAWLLEVHKTHPIAFVARGEDSEAGGTELDAWHAESVAGIARLLPLFEAQAARAAAPSGDTANRVKRSQSESEHARYPIAIALAYARDAGIPLTLSPSLSKWVESDADDAEDEAAAGADPDADEAAEDDE